MDGLDKRLFPLALFLTTGVDHALASEYSLACSPTYAASHSLTLTLNIILKDGITKRSLLKKV